MATRTPRKGKAKVKITSSGKKVSYGQAGKAKGGGPRVKAGTAKGDSYCARSLRRSRTIPTLLITYRARDGNAQALSLRGNTMKKSCGCKDKKRPLPKRGQRVAKNKKSKKRS